MDRLERVLARPDAADRDDLGGAVRRARRQRATNKYRVDWVRDLVMRARPQFRQKIEHVVVDHDDVARPRAARPFDTSNQTRARGRGCLPQPAWPTKADIRVEHAVHREDDRAPPGPARPGQRVAGRVVHMDDIGVEPFDLAADAMGNKVPIDKAARQPRPCHVDDLARPVRMTGVRRRSSGDQRDADAFGQDHAQALHHALHAALGRAARDRMIAYENNVHVLAQSAKDRGLVAMRHTMRAFNATDRRYRPPSCQGTAGVSALGTAGA